MKPALPWLSFVLTILLLQPATAGAQSLSGTMRAAPPQQTVEQAPPVPTVVRPGAGETVVGDLVVAVQVPPGVPARAYTIEGAYWDPGRNGWVYPGTLGDTFAGGSTATTRVPSELLARFSAAGTRWQIHVRTTDPPGSWGPWREFGWQPVPSVARGVAAPAPAPTDMASATLGEGETPGMMVPGASGSESGRPSTISRTPVGTDEPPAQPSAQTGTDLPAVRQPPPVSDQPATPPGQMATGLPAVQQPPASSGEAVPPPAQAATGLPAVQQPPPVIDQPATPPGQTGTGLPAVQQPPPVSDQPAPPPGQIATGLPAAQQPPAPSGRPAPSPVLPAMSLPPVQQPPVQQAPAQQPPVQQAPAQQEPVQPLQVQLVFGQVVPGTKKPVWGGTQKTFDKHSALARLVWQTAQPGAYQWRWQIASTSFPADPGVQPPGLLNEGDAYYDYFTLDLTPYLPPGAEPGPTPAEQTKKLPAKPGAKQSPGQAGSVVVKDAAPTLVASQQALPLLPTKFHIRLIALQGGKPTGVKSNTVIADYQPGSSAPDPKLWQAYNEAEAEKKKAQALADKAKDIFELKILSLQLAVFPDPNRWGCVKVLSNPFAGNMLHPLSPYKPGEYCPPPDPKYQQKSAWDKYVVGSFEGWAFAWDKLSGYYNGAKSWIAGQIADQVPCDWLGEKLQDECKTAIEQMVSGAISAGLAVVGLPPSLPDLDALSDASKGEIADAAVEFSCQTFESNGGTCTPEMRAQLKAYYKQGLDELQKQVATEMKHEVHEPGCGETATAAEYGRLPLPCFSDYPGVVVEPASGSVYEPPRVKVRVTRKMPQPSHIKGCDEVTVSMELKNTFAGGYLSGKKLPPAQVSGDAYLPASSGVPPLAVGTSADLVIEMAKMAVVEVPGNYYGKFHLPNWLVLYLGGKGTLSAGMWARVDAGAASGLYKELGAPCAAGDSLPVQIPE